MSDVMSICDIHDGINCWNMFMVVLMIGKIGIA
jgi:hypothetical protein